MATAMGKDGSAGSGEVRQRLHSTILELYGRYSTSGLNITLGALDGCWFRGTVNILLAFHRNVLQAVRGTRGKLHEKFAGEMDKGKQ